MYKTVLVCDDAVYSRTIIIDILQNMGEFIVLETENGKEAVNTYYEYIKKGKEIDLVLVDMEMKKINGIQTLKYLKELNPDCKIVLCGTRLKDETLMEAMQCGVKHFLIKPYKRKQVESILAEIL